MGQLGRYLDYLDSERNIEAQKLALLTGCGEESSGILNMRDAIRDQHHKSKESHDLEPQQENTSLTCLVGKVAAGDSANTGKGIGWDCHKLRGVVGKPELLDDCGKEQGDGVEWGEQSDRN